MKFATLASATLLAATASAADVACRVNGQQQSVVDLDTGSCEFLIPSEYPVNFRFTAADDYLVDAYYIFRESKYFNDIRAAGRSISVPARLLYNQGSVPLFHVHAEENPNSNSTAALRKRFNSQLKVKRDEEDDLVASIEAAEGTAVDVSVEVNDPDASSSGATTTTRATTEIITITSCSDNKCSESTLTSTHAAVTTTAVHTTMITITSCHEDKCHETTVPATQGPTTVTNGDDTTVYTTWCPVTEATKAAETKIITITSCHEDKCHETTVPATHGPTTVTNGDDTTVYTTWCPVVESTKAAEIKTVTITNCNGEDCHVTTAPATWGESTVVTKGETSVVTTWCPVTTETVTTGAVTTGAVTTGKGETVASLSTVITSGVSTVASQTPAVSTAFNGAGKLGASLALVAVPLAYLL